MGKIRSEEDAVSANQFSKPIDIVLVIRRNPAMLPKGLDGITLKRSGRLAIRLLQFSDQGCHPGAPALDARHTQARMALKEPVADHRRESIVDRFRGEATH